MKNAFADNDNHARLSMPTKAMESAGARTDEGLMDMQGWRQARPERMKIQQI